MALIALMAIGYDVMAGPGVSDGNYFSYFTVLSNLFAVAMLLHGALRRAYTRSRTVELLRGAAVVYILTTGIVYLLLLSGHAPAYPWVNAILHYLMPVAVTLAGARRNRGLVPVLLREPPPQWRLPARRGRLLGGRDRHRGADRHDDLGGQPSPRHACQRLLNSGT
jgi:peptidoglycan/LPS O-acetylase OafA/YrhL